MPTHVVYIDDSGTKEYAATEEDYGLLGCSRYFVFGSIIISTTESSRLAVRIQNAKNHFFGTDSVEIKSNWLRMPKERERRYLQRYSITEDQLRSFVDVYYKIISTTDLQLIAAVVDKVHVKADYPSPWYAPAIAYEILMQRVVQAVPVPNSISIVIDDMTGATPRGNQYKKNLNNHHTQLRRSGSSLYRGISFDPLAGDIRFINSAFSHQVQVADVVSYNIYRQFVQHGPAWEADNIPNLPTYEWFLRLWDKFRRGPNGRVQGYGLVKFPMRKRVPWA